MDYGVSVASLAPSHSEVTVSHLGTFIHQSDGLGASVASLAHAHSKVTIPRMGHSPLNLMTLSDPDGRPTLGVLVWTLRPKFALFFNKLIL